MPQQTASPPSPARRITRNQFYWTIAVVIMLLQTAIILSLLGHAPDDTTFDRAARPIVSHLGLGQSTLVVGVFDKPLGTKITLTGHVGRPENWLIWSDETGFEVTSIDGEPCSPSRFIVIRSTMVVRDSGTPEPEKPLKEGVEYKIIGWETGEFYGPPHWTRSGMQQPFQFKPYFWIWSAEPF